MFDINRFKNLNAQKRYDRQLNRMFSQGSETEHVKNVVQEAITNIGTGKKSFVIYGEPQSGKTEMMIALTARLLDEEHRIVVVLLNDNVQLLQQNLDRFRGSDIDPTPRDISEILEENIGDKTWIIFCKKNIRDLNRLIEKLYKKRDKIIIDDEADFASPNARINRDERTAINNAIYKLLGDDGIYIGVTATPARLDMNNTFDNMTEDWICFTPHKDYVGKDIFFPLDFGPQQYSPIFLPTTGDYPIYLREALLSFFVNVAYINIVDDSVKKQAKTPGKENAFFSFLVHTSGRTADHKTDEETVNKLIDSLSDDNHKLFPKFVERMHTITVQRYGQRFADDIVKFVILNIGKKFITVLNAVSKAGRKVTLDLTNPPALFTIIIGGNIISRGVTFNNLLGMFFTRDVKHKMQQDTYIQRARMFGNRRNYLKYFELWIPEQLYLDWHRCFVYHQLSLEAIKADKKAPVWISDDRIQPVAPGSIDKKSVVTDAGEMYFAKFNLGEKLVALIQDKNLSELNKIQEINKTYGEKILPSYVMSFIQINPYPSHIAVHDIRRVRPDSDYHDTLYRPRGVLGGEDIKKFPNAVHHFMVIANTMNEARIVYKYAGKVYFLKNLKKEAVLNV
jgi:Txe/YoeB family toxin of Txe-Axe toxin-antitoxin module